MSEVSSRKASGHWEAMGLAGELTSGETLTCRHCQTAWIIQKGSGKTRGFCTRCMGYTCGGPDCIACIPVEVRLTNAEAGRDELTPAPQSIVVPPGWDYIK